MSREQRLPEPLVFHMGEYAATIPCDRRYCWNHMWCLPDAVGTGVHRFGFTAYAVRLLRDVYFLEWYAEPGDVWETRQEIGAIESSKAESSLYAPISGRLVRLNDRLLDDPAWINVDTYGDGWLFEVEGQVDGTMTAHEYVEYLGEVWPKAQRMIKGQL